MSGTSETSKFCFPSSWKTWDRYHFKNMGKPEVPIGKSNGTRHSV